MGEEQVSRKAKKRLEYKCSRCHAVYAAMTNRCPSCSSIFTLYPIQASRVTLEVISNKPSGEVVATFTEDDKESPEVEPNDTTMGLDDVPDFEGEFTETGIESLDDILGGGIFNHCVIMLGAEPGTGKSTILLQAIAALVQAKRKCLLCIGEEHPAIVKARIKRLGFAKLLSNRKLFRLSVGKSWDSAVENIDAFDPDFIAVDSADRYTVESINGGPGSEAQKSAVIQAMIDIIHDDEHEKPRSGIVLSHFNGDGTFKGVKGNAHDVDTTVVMRRMGEDSPIIRISCEGKNRFGETGFVRYLEMQGKGAERQGLVSIDQVKATSETAFRGDTKLSD